MRRARDVTDAAARRSAVILAPHPDDETLGCGATIIRKVRAGSAVTVVMVTDGRHSHRSSAIGPAELAALRRGELVEAVARLGLPAEAVRWVDIEDGAVAASEDRLTEVIGDLLRTLRPDELYATTAEDPHPDHAAVGRAARRAAAATTGVALLEYPIWLWGIWPLRPGRRWRSLVEAIGRVTTNRAVSVRCAEFADQKMHALQAHASQLRRPSEIPPGEDWHVLPPTVLAAAADAQEVFFPAEGGRR
ncbi:PIG-L deacetylase family protein [Microbacterium ureisolvens]|uniref:PIG-L deacetylase family protein n=1 Tax=Microbacterium ureisolvens TaxID=2781186 RepID=UPI00362D7419